MLFRYLCQLHRLRQVHEAGWNVAREGVVQSLPLRREVCEGIIDRSPGLIGGIDEQGYRRLHSFVQQ